MCVANNRWVRLHSDQDPVAEAEALASKVLGAATPSIVIFVGVGLGYVVDAIERLSPSTRVLVVEPLAETAAAMLERRDWRERIASGLLCMLVGPDFAGASEAWRFVDDVEHPPLLVASVFQRELPAETAKAREVAVQAVFGARANAEARRRFAPRYLCNTLRNAAAISRSADIDVLRGALSGVPAVLVAAGPSLDRQIETLRRVGTRAVIIAVDTAVRPLLDAGIYPDLAVALDPSVANARHLKDLTDPRRPFLVAEGSMDPEALAPFDGRLFVFEVSGHHPWPWLRSIGIDRGRLRAWGSVLTAAFDLALEAGCDPIVFAGADLAYSAGRPYARGTTFENDWADRVAAGEPLDDIWRIAVQKTDAVQIRGCDGADVTTGPQLLEFRNWIVAQSGVCGRHVVNTTGAGALEGPAIEQQTLEDVLATLPEDAWAGREAIQSIWLRGRSQALDLTPAFANLPHEAWLAFGGPDLRKEDIAEAVAAALLPASIPALSSSTSRGSLPYAPERVALIRAAIFGDKAAERTLAARVRAAQVPRLAEAVERVDARLADIVSSPAPLVVEPRADDPPQPPKAPASRAFKWQPKVLPAARAYEAALSDVIVARSRHDEETPGRRPAAAVSCEPATDDAVREWSADMPALIGVLADYAAVVSRNETDAAALRAYSAMTPAQPDSSDALSVFVSTGTRRRTLVADGASLRSAMADALAGTIVGVSDDAPRRIAAWWPGECAPIGRVAAARVGAADLGACTLGAVLDEGHVVFANLFNARSLRIDAGGRLDVHAEWPELISGIVRWGGDGAIAWRNPYVMWRSRPDETVRMETIPFKASVAYPQPDGSVWWTAFSGGVWSWTPGGEWKQLVDSPPVMSLRVEDGLVRLDPRGDDSTFRRKPDATDAYYWTPGTSSVMRRPLGPDGPIWSTSSRNGWTASAFPWGDQIGLEHVGGQRRLLVCPRPFTVAWAGDSLVVSTREGQLTYFEKLWGTLDQGR